MKEAPEEFPNRLWTHRDGYTDPFDRVDALRERFAKLGLLVTLLILMQPFVIWWVVSGARKPNPVTVVSDGRVFSGKLERNYQIPDKFILNQFEETLMALFARTQAGGVAEVKDFVGPGIAEYVDSLYKPKKAGKKDQLFSQHFTITASRLFVADSQWAVLGVRGLLNSRTIDGYQPTEIFWVAGFSRLETNERNGTGWRLVRLLPDVGGRIFFDDEIKAERASRLGLEVKDSPVPPSQ